MFMFLFASLNYLKNLDYVFKLAPVAMGALIISTITLIGSIPFNLDNINSSFFHFPHLSFKDVLAVASINGFALICHPSVSPMIKENEDQKSNAKAVYVGFGITTALYILVGVLGALAIVNRGVDKHNIIEYFSGSFQAPLIGFLIFLYLFLISPIFPYVSKNQAL
jgi:amino acid permease